MSHKARRRPNQQSYDDSDGIGVDHLLVFDAVLTRLSDTTHIPSFFSRFSKIRIKSTEKPCIRAALILHSLCQTFINTQEIVRPLLGAVEVGTKSMKIPSFLFVYYTLCAYC